MTRRTFDRISFPFCVLLFLSQYYYLQIKNFLNKIIVSINYTIESQERVGMVIVLFSLRFGGVKIDSRESIFFFQTAK